MKQADKSNGTSNNADKETNQKFLEVQEPFSKKVPGRRRHFGIMKDRREKIIETITRLIDFF